MGVVSEKYIMQRLSEYVKSDTGKARIAQHRKDVFNGRRKGGNGGLTRDRLESILQEIRDKFVVAVIAVIASFRGDGVTTITGEMDEEGNVRASLLVDEDALRRESLHYMKKDLSIGHGEGINDILALFTHGYAPLDRQPHGFWVHDNGVSMERTSARLYRDPNPFLSDFVKKMNQEYSGKCFLTLNEKYIIGGGSE